MHRISQRHDVMPHKSTAYTSLTRGRGKSSETKERLPLTYCED